MCSTIGKIVGFLIAVTLIIGPREALAASEGSTNLAKAEQLVEQSLAEAGQGHLTEANSIYQKFPDAWLKIEDSVKKESGQAYRDIETNMGQVAYAFIQNKQDAVVQALQGLKTVNDKFIQGQYGKDEQFKKENISLADFIILLQQTKDKTEKQDQQAALAQIAKVRQSWLSVEGVVVAQSASLYSDSERDMVTINGAISAGDYSKATQMAEAMITYLTPLAAKTGYSLWDAAMIPIREGLEALLVVAALLAYVKKADSSHAHGKRWIWLGVTAGLLLSIIVAVIVKFVFSSGAFGNNNFLITGWTGIIAAAMLLYMSFWLHRQSSISDWNQYLRAKSHAAIKTGRLVSLGVLAFLAIFREGTETVLFLIGMVNQISLQNLIFGLLAGVGILTVLAYLMLVIGMKLPMRPFFMVSSLIVFYLCIKFTGMGIHTSSYPVCCQQQMPSFPASIFSLCIHPGKVRSRNSC